MRTRTLSGFFALLSTLSIVLAACGGGGGGGGSSVAPGVNPTGGVTSTPTTPGSSGTVPLSTSGSQTATFAVNGYSSVATVPASSVATSLSATFSTTQPGSTPTIQDLKRRPANISGNSIVALAFLCVAPAASVTLAGYPSFTLTTPTTVNAAYAYVAYYNPVNPTAGWTTIEGPASGSGTTLTFTGGGALSPLQSGQTYCFLFFTLSSAIATPTMAPSATPTLTSTSPTAFTCPTNDSAADTVARSSAVMGSDAVRRSNGLRTPRTADTAATGLLAVTYSTATASSGRADVLAASERSAGGTMVQQFTFARSGQVIHVLSVPAAQMSTVAARLRTQSGVESVAPTGMRRYSTAVAAPYFPNDPYFNGFFSYQNNQAGSSAATTYQIAPYEESSSVPGQWDMHAIKLEDALAYSQSGNGSGITNSGALGSASVKIAIIDTGEDPNHPELSSKIAYQKCFITNDAGSTPGPQSSGNFETDPLGHGTDVSGIAAADTSNNFGFVGAGGNVSIYAYRVFPTPDDTCTSDTGGDNQCGADTIDIASAINDAVAQGVNVISMSLGGGGCSNGVDSDPTEGAAVADAINHNVIVVAASGNSGGSGVSAPACDTGVIAVGATSLADGSRNATNSLGTPSSPVEYVTSYTQYGSPNTLRSASSWGIVAPGGDPLNDSDTDDLHWIENIWTTTPFRQNANDTSFTGECTDDYPNSTGLTSPVDCRTLIAGTSMATPHVAGAAALILSATGGGSSIYQSSSAMKTLLCTYADDLPVSSSVQGCGRLNVYTAMAHALNDPSPPTPIP